MNYIPYIAAIGALFFASCSSNGDGDSSSAPPIQWPKSTGKVSIKDPKVVTGTLDGKMKTYNGSGLSGDCGQGENMEPMFIARDGATIKNMIIEEAPDGIHVEGDNVTIENVWFKNVCEDAITLGTGNPQNCKILKNTFNDAADKIIQLNDGDKGVIDGNRFNIFKSAIRKKKAFGNNLKVSGNLFSNGQSAVSLDSGAKEPEQSDNQYFNVTYKVRK